jgi:hypothetical protein
MSDFIFHSAQRIRELEEIIGYEFKDKSLLDRALQAAGFGLLREGNKPLALIGDATLKLIIRMMGYETNASIGEIFLDYTWKAVCFNSNSKRPYNSFTRYLGCQRTPLAD